MLICNFDCCQGNAVEKKEERVPQMDLFNDFVCISRILIPL